MPREYYERLIINDISPSSSMDSGALTVKGGISCYENIFLGGHISIRGISIKSPSDATEYDFILPKNIGCKGDVLCSFGRFGTQWVKPTGSGNIVLSNNPSFGGLVNLSKTNINIGTVSDSTTTGALTVTGGISTQNNLNVAGYIGIGDNIKIKSVSSIVYNFTLPSSPGNRGEVLTSGGGSDSPMYWSCMKDLFSKPPVLGSIIPSSALLTQLSIGSTLTNFPIVVKAKDGDIMSFINGATRVGTITTDGYSTTYGTTSDHRLKENVRDYTSGIETIMRLRPVTFNYKKNYERIVGFIAHELQKEVPEAVSGEFDAINDDGSIRAQMVEYGRLTPYIVSALQEITEELIEINKRCQCGRKSKSI